MAITHYCPATTHRSAMASFDLYHRHASRVQRGRAVLRTRGRPDRCRRWGIYQVPRTYFEEVRQIAVSARWLARHCDRLSERREYLALARYASNESECNVRGLCRLPERFS